MLLNCGVGEDSWESLGLQGDKPVHPKWDQSWVFIGRTDVEAETPILWPPHAKSWLIWKDPDAGKDWGQEEKGTTEDEMVLDGNGFGWTLGVGRPGVLQFMGLQRVGQNWATELNWNSATLLNSIRSPQPLLAPGTSFVEYNCSTDGGGGLGWGWMVQVVIWTHEESDGDWCMAQSFTHFPWCSSPTVQSSS